MDWLAGPLNRLTTHFRRVVVRPPADRRDVSALQSRFGAIPEDLERFYTHCDGIAVGLRDNVVGHLLALHESLDCIPFASDCEPERRFLPIRGDGCGDYDCVVLGEGLCEGAVVFWDHEVYLGPSYLLAGSISSYVQMWVDHLLNRYFPDGAEDPRYIPPHLDVWPWLGKPERQHPWPFDESWIKARDTKAAEILDDPTTRNWLLKQDELI